MKKYKVLSVRQPYANLICKGIKDIENRSRRTNYRGKVLIHASAKMHEDANRLICLDSKPYEQEFYFLCTKIINEKLLGCIIGSVDIVDCVQNHPSEWAEKGQWHWVCANAKKFEHPIRDVKGKLGIWEWEGEV